MAVLQRTSFGVSGIQAADRFDVSASVLSGFVVLQVAIYAAMQIPAGILLDRFGSRATLASGALILALGQISLALTDDLSLAIAARAVVGAGDAFTFISVLRLLPRWFSEARVPLFSQLTSMLGQAGQLLSAVPFTTVLITSGWTSAYLSAASLAVIGCVLTLAIVRNSPSGVDVEVTSASFADLPRQVRAVWRTNGTRLGFLTHMGTSFPMTVFALMWGVPFLTYAEGLSQSEAGGMLTISVVTTTAVGPVLGMLSGKYPNLRGALVIGVIASNIVVWTSILLLPHPAPGWLLILLVAVMALGSSTGMIGFDFARASNMRQTMGTAQGIVNAGGFSAALLVIMGMGLVLDYAGGYTLAAFRIAWLLVYGVSLPAAVGVFFLMRQVRANDRLDQSRSAEVGSIN
ncbi:MFS transporter [Nocardia pseudovaccinii]|uniref:MFS transporter n=1 Tax=Nocardia pseudovaccinii TaxID=189540 RepID=UPI003D89DED5